LANNATAPIIPPSLLSTGLAVFGG
jgi:hypothetical protein